MAFTADDLEQEQQHGEDPIAALRAKKQQGVAPPVDPIAALRASKADSNEDPIAAMRRAKTDGPPPIPPHEVDWSITRPHTEDDIGGGGIPMDDPLARAGVVPMSGATTPNVPLPQPIKTEEVFRPAPVEFAQPKHSTVEKLKTQRAAGVDRAFHPETRTPAPVVAAPSDALPGTVGRRSGGVAATALPDIGGETLQSELRRENEANAVPDATTLAGRVVQMAGKSAYEHPLTALIALAAPPQLLVRGGTIVASHALGQFAGQEMQKRLGTWEGPDVVSRREAAFAAGQMLASGVAMYALPQLDKYLEGVFGQSMARATVRAIEEGKPPAQAILIGWGARGARTAVHAGVGAGVGAAFSPDDPEAGAILGAAIGGANAARQAPKVTLRDDVLGAATRSAPRLPAGEPAPTKPPIKAVARALGDEEPQREPDFAVESRAGNSAGTVPPAPEDYLTEWDEKRMGGPKPTRQEYELWKRRAVDSMLEAQAARSAKGEKVPGFGQSPREAVATPPGRETTRVATPEERGPAATALSIPPSEKDVVVGKPVPREGRRFPATAAAIVDYAKQKNLPTAEAAKRLTDAGYDVSEEATAKAKDIAGEKHSYSSTQLNLPAPQAKAITDLAGSIPESDLAADGRETEPHITVKYGLHTADPEKLRELLRDHPPIPVTFGKTSVFPAGESGSGDVLKVDVDSPELHALNRKIADALDNTDEHSGGARNTLYSKNANDVIGSRREADLGGESEGRVPDQQSYSVAAQAANHSSAGGGSGSRAGRVRSEGGPNSTETRRPSSLSEREVRQLETPRDAALS